MARESWWLRHHVGVLSLCIVRYVISSTLVHLVPLDPYTIAIVIHILLKVLSGVFDL